jgi:tRNA-(ms[2]io[6]A)-hydroxylase
MENQNSLTTLGLQLPTDPRWVNMAEISLESILTDHAYCEQKASLSCIALISQYPEHFEMVKELAPIVTEEWGHFRLVIQELEKRNLKLGRQRKDEYVNGLLKFQKKGGDRTVRLVEKLLTFALIEARSCERFRLLSLHIKEVELREFYRKFMVSEAGHYRLFIKLANSFLDETVVRKRWKEYLAYEEELMKELEVRGDRMH